MIIVTPVKSIYFSKLAEMLEPTGIQWPGSIPVTKRCSISDTVNYAAIYESHIGTRVLLPVEYELVTWNMFVRYAKLAANGELIRFFETNEMK